MSLNYKDYVNIDSWSDKLERSVQSIKQKYATSSPNDVVGYLDDLRDIFENDIKNLTQYLYDIISIQKDIDFTAEELKECIMCGVESLFDKYEQYLRTYNSGGVIFNINTSLIPSLQEKITLKIISFRDEASKILNDEASALVWRWIMDKKNNNPGGNTTNNTINNYGNMINPKIAQAQEINQNKKEGLIKRLIAMYHQLFDQ